MATTATTEAYQILVRFVGGVPSGAHYTTLQTITEDGLVLSVTESAPEPLPLNSLVFSATAAAALNRVTELTVEVEALKIAKAAALARVVELDAEVDALINR